MQRRIRAERAPRSGARAERRRLRGSARRLERAAEPEISRGERVRLAERAERDVLRRPRPDAGHGTEALLEIVQAAGSGELDLLRVDGGRERPDRVRARAGNADSGEVRSGERGRRRENVRQAVRASAGQRPSERLDEPSRESPRAAYGNLLPENRANGDLERIPGAGHAKSRAGRDERREERIAAQHGADRERIRVDVEDAPRAAHEVEEIPPREKLSESRRKSCPTS